MICRSLKSYPENQLDLTKWSTISIQPMGRTSDANERLMDAALDLIWEESYGAVTIDDICKRADVKKGSFYYFFNSKSELAIAALERMWNEESKPRMDQPVFRPTVEPLGPHHAPTMDQHGRISEGNPRKAREGAGLPGIFGRLRDRALAARKAPSATRCARCSCGSCYYESAIRDAMAQGSIEPGDAAAKAVALNGLMKGTLTQARILNDPAVLKDASGPRPSDSRREAGPPAPKPDHFSSSYADPHFVNLTIPPPCAVF